jgi:hypothetical protein
MNTSSTPPVTATLPSFNSAFPTDWESNPFPSGGLNPDYLPWKADTGMSTLDVHNNRSYGQSERDIPTISPSALSTRADSNRDALDGAYDLCRFVVPTRSGVRNK